MEKIIRFSLLLCLFSFCVSVPSYAQKRKKKKANEEYFDESGGFAHRLWYGGNFNLGLSNNAFNIGITPMIGYKFNDRFSAGPRFTIDYLSGKINFTNGSTFNYRTTSWGVGAFGRAKVITNFFAHMEFAYQNLGVPDLDENGFVKIDTDDPNKILTTRENKNSFFLGAGYTSGTILSYEVLVLYDVMEGSDSNRLPWDLRFGITYNF